MHVRRWERRTEVGRHEEQESYYMSLDQKHTVFFPGYLSGGYAALFASLIHTSTPY